MIGKSPLLPLDMRATYRICIIGELESSFANSYWGMTSSAVEEAGELEQTMLVGEVADQAALVGIINALYNKGYTIVSVERIVLDEDLSLNDKDKET